ncbi:hypothetical protein HC028_18500 [Planosporangium flavigriseum]|uniref:Transposase, Mutator family n=1 Tax=Planosporangium flavigriseum TaxID=373681 RepID=A0A8J3LZI9_9ACTN|nr:hypothetical protein [Planosporangium flavigriseum]NJC66479.1 hypothetical protein [Planosporangium flavigriseum]GIG76356.1 hypothetical protein Pfl04_47600 [Planosporangium flavigriseum]
MTTIQADIFAEAVLQRCAELLYADMKPQVEAHTARRRKSSTPAPSAAPTPARSLGGNVVSLTAFRTRKATAAA